MIKKQKCKRPTCNEFAAINQAYCTIQCSPYGLYFCSPKEREKNIKRNETIDNKRRSFYEKNQSETIEVPLKKKRKVRRNPKTYIYKVP